MRRKVTIVGAGATGGAMAQLLVEKGYCDTVLVDGIEGMPQGKALDLAQGAALLGSDVRVVGSNGWEETAGSDVVVITSGVARKPGMSREDLVNTNAGIVREVAQKALRFSPDAFLIQFSNPMDPLCHVAKDVTGLPRGRIVGQGGMLDSARYRAFIAQELGVSVKDVHAYVLGGHTDVTMVPVVSTATVGGIPLGHLLSAERLQAVVERTRRGGTEIVNLMKTSAWFAPAVATVEMVEAVLRDRKRVLPCSVYLEGEYGIRGAFVGVLAQLGAGGMERVLEVPLAAEEVQGLRRAAEAVKELVGLVRV